jgi:hypothetical protein
LKVSLKIWVWALFGYEEGKDRYFQDTEEDVVTSSGGVEEEFLIKVLSDTIISLPED